MTLNGLENNTKTEKQIYSIFAFVFMIFLFFIFLFLELFLDKAAMVYGIRMECSETRVAINNEVISPWNLCSNK